LLANALNENRAALAGPFAGATLPVDLPMPLDKADRLEHWDVLPRLQACETELLSGLCFDIKQGSQTVELGFVNLDQKKLQKQTLVTLRRPTVQVFKQQLDLVANYAELRNDRGSEVLAQTLPSQVPFWAPVIGMQPHRHPWTQQLVALALSLTVSVEMRFKHAFACPRPFQLSPQIQPMIPTPGHGSWPSGHATESYVVAVLLQSLLQNVNGNGSAYGEQLQRLAARVATNRVVAGVHYPVDSAVGRLLGTALAEFFVARCIGSTKLHERGFDGTKFHGPKGTVVDFDPRVSMEDNKSGYYEYLSRIGSVSSSSLLAFMWTKAAKEWLPLK
jgi:hypothetical protein